MGLYDYLYMFFVLLLLLGVMYGMLYLMKRFVYSTKGNKQGKIGIEVLSTQAILPKKFVTVVKINNKIYLLGVSEQSVNVIDKLDENEIDYSESSEFESENSFKDLFKKNLGLK